MNQYLSKHFATNAERVDYHVYGIYGDIEFEPRAKFIIGLDGMLCEESMVIGQNDFGHLYSALNQSTYHWALNFEKTDIEFKKLWTTKEWNYLLEYENKYKIIYSDLTKYGSHKVPKLFSNEDYIKLRKITKELFDNLTTQV